MKRIFTSTLSCLVSFMALGGLVLSLHTVAVAQIDISSGQMLPTTASPILPDLNFCLQDPETGRCVQIPVGYAQANLTSANGSGITAQLHLVDTGTTLSATGTAKGMDPTKVYVTLIYDRNSVPTGDRACLPTDNSLSFPAQMVMGVWLPLGSPVRTLHAVKVGTTGQLTDYAPLGAIGTISIREDTQVGQPIPDRPAPQRFLLRACARVDSQALFQ